MLLENIVQILDIISTRIQEQPHISVVLGLVILLVLIYIARWTRKGPRLLPGAPFVGLNGGKSSKQDATHRYILNSSSLLEEGYKLVCRFLSIIEEKMLND